MDFPRSTNRTAAPPSRWPVPENAVLKGIFRTKNLDEILKSAEDSEHSLKRSLGAFQVTLLGIGAIIGAGIFATVGTAAAGDAVRPGAGPSLMLSFAITAVVCAFTAICYAEMASMVPISGSAYTYSYATLGELVAWIIGWDLIIEYAVGNVAVAISWANYFRTFLHDIGIDVPLWLATDYRTAAAKMPEVVANAPHIGDIPIVFNFLGFAIVAVITIVLVWGIRESARFNAIMVGIKILVLMFFVGIAVHYVAPSEMAKNWVPFQPNGWAGTLTGAAVVFFAYIGFDAVSTVAEETKNPSRDLPIGIIASLLICTVFYVLVAAVFTGMLPYSELVTRLTTEQAEPLTMALNHVAPDNHVASGIVAFGSVIAHTAVLLVFQLGQPRIFFSMARDGLLPQSFAKVHPRFKTPHVTTILTGVAVGVFAAVMNIDEMVDLTNIGTLFAFVLVCIGITVLRIKDPSRPRPFRVPFGAWLMPMLGVASCLFLMFYLPPASWWRFVGWLVLGLSIYTSYGYARSGIGRAAGRPALTPPQLKLASLGFLAAAIGLFTIPHASGPARLIATALGTNHDLTAEDFGREGGGATFDTIDTLAGYALENHSGHPLVISVQVEKAGSEWTTLARHELADGAHVQHALDVPAPVRESSLRATVDDDSAPGYGVAFTVKEIQGRAALGLTLILVGLALGIGGCAGAGRAAR
jgi:APA family basic amino acid/polyamine antiporter